MLSRVLIALLCLTSMVQAQQIALDGDTSEWSEETHVIGSTAYVDLRLTFPDIRPLNGSGDPVRIAIDTDGNDRTGKRVGDEPGADVVVTFNDPDAGRRAWRPTVTTADGQTIDLGSLSPDVQPTYASSTYEVRLYRSPEVARLLGDKAWSADGPLEVSVIDESRESHQQETMLRAALILPEGKPETNSAAVSLPAKDPDQLRILSYNVLWAGPMRDDPGPAPYVRLLRAIDPDVMFFQEWYDRATDGQLDTRQREDRVRRWFEKNLPGDRPWNVMSGEAQGVLVVTRYPMMQRGPDTVPVTNSRTRWDFPVRLASAMIQTPHGPIVVGGLHLKCCGSYQSQEDLRRADEATAINRTLGQLSHQDGSRLPIIVGGDFNHVGGQQVMATLMNGLDTDGSSMTPATPRVLGTSYIYTHGTPERSNGPRSRLDYITYSDDSLSVARAFVLDASRLSEQSLNAAGLLRSDVNASDHLPVIVDLQFKKQAP